MQKLFFISFRNGLLIWSTHIIRVSTIAAITFSPYFCILTDWNISRINYWLVGLQVIHYHQLLVLISVHFHEIATVAWDSFFHIQLIYFQTIISNFIQVVGTWSVMWLFELFLCLRIFRSIVESFEAFIITCVEFVLPAQQ